MLPLDDRINGGLSGSTNTVTTVNATDETSDPIDSADAATTLEESSVTESSKDSMEEYQQLKRELYVITLSMTAVAFVTVALVFDLRIALNYLLGAVTGIVYLRLLAKDIDKIGNESTKFSPNRLALFVALMLAAAKWHELQILPVFLGFLTYKVALIVYILRTLSIAD